MTDDDHNVPQRYGDNKIVLIARDPDTLYTYWEIRKDIQDNLIEKIRSKELTISKKVLRIFNIVQEERDSFLHDIFCDYEVNDWDSSWYVHTNRAGEKWMASIGFLCTNGTFFTLVQSNIVKTPACAASKKYPHERLTGRIDYTENISGVYNPDKSGKK